MANGHGHGAFGAQVISNQDMTRHTSAMSDTLATDVSEDTGLMPPGDYKSFLQGNTGVSASASMWFVNDPDYIARERIRWLSRQPQPLTRAWRGFETGKYVSMYTALSTELSRNVSNSSTITKSLNHQCASVMYDGWALFSPFGSTAFAGTNEVQLLTFTSVNENIFLGLRAAGETETFAFQLSSYANDAAIKAAIKAGIEGLAAYDGRTVTITGTLTKTGSAWSGTYTLTFDGETNLPELEARQGVVDRFQVTSGDGDSDYSANGGGTFALGISESTFQTNQRAIGGQFAAVVCKGTSTAPSGGPTDNLALAASVSEIGSRAGYGSVGLLNDGDTDVGGSGFQVTSGSSGQWKVIFDLGISKYLDRFVLYHADASVASISIHASNTGAFSGEEVTLASTFDLNGGPTTTKDVTRGQYRYIAIFSEPDDFYGDLYEFEIYDTQATPGVGAADLYSYFPLTATPAVPSATGTGAANARVTAAGAASAVAVATSIDGSSPSQYGGAIWTLVDDTTSGDWHDAQKFLDPESTVSTGGFYARMHVLLAAGTGFTAVIEHADTTGGSATTLATFTVTDITQLSQLVQEYAATAGTSVKRYVRVRFTSVTGTFAVAFSYARESY